MAVVEDDVMLADLLVMALQVRLKPAELRCFSRGSAGIEHCRTVRPDLLIVDLGLPDMDGRQVIRHVRAASPDTRIIVLTGQVANTLPSELLALSVRGYIDKGSALTNAEAAIARVLEGGIYYSVGGAPSRKPEAFAPAPREWGRPETLTEREREIVRAVANGMISKEIAERLKLSPRTVEKARARILAKLQVRDLPSLIKWSVEHGLS